MVRVHQPAPVFEPVLVGVPEREILRLEGKGLEHGTMGDATEGKNYPIRIHGPELGMEKTVAVTYFGADGLVLGRHAFNGIGDTAVMQFQTITPMEGFRLTGEP
jgi:hypothetical protein